MTKVLLKGKGKWISKSIKEWTKPDGTVDRKWTFSFYPDEDSREQIMELQARGLKNRLKKDTEGWFVSLSRPVNKKMGGKDVTFEPPYITDEAGKDIADSVGNGSEVVTELFVYEHPVPGSSKKSVAARWEGVQITKLIPYNTTTGKSTSTDEDSEPLF